MAAVKVRALLRKLSLSVLTGVVMLVVAECVARNAEPGPFTLYDRSPYDEHEELHHVHKKNFRGAWDGSYYQTNSRGWRGPEFAPTFAPSELRVVALGDSCTFGKAVEDSETWPRQLESMLREGVGASRSALVANLGVNGYAARDYVNAYLSQAADCKPQVIVIGYNINDFPNVVRQVDAKVFHNDQNLRAMFSHRWREQLGKLAMFRWLRNRYYDSNRERDFAKVEALATEAGADAQTSPERMQLEEERLRKLVDACKESGAHVVLFLFPYESQVYLDKYARGPIDVVEGLARKLGVEHVPMLEEFRAEAQRSDPPKRLFNRGDRYHPNAEGYAIVARTLKKFLDQRGWTRLPE
jgi:lysophospholipase L1-like esterase